MSLKTSTMSPAAIPSSWASPGFISRVTRADDVVVLVVIDVLSKDGCGKCTGVPHISSLVSSTPTTRSILNQASFRLGCSLTGMRGRAGATLLRVQTSAGGIAYLFSKGGHDGMRPNVAFFWQCGK